MAQPRQGPPPAFIEQVAKARELAKAGKNAEAKLAYESALKVVPNDTAALVELSQVLVAVGDLPYAVRLVEKALEFERAQAAGVQAALLASLARIEVKRGDASRARVLFAQSLAHKEAADVRAELGVLGPEPAGSTAEPAPVPTAAPTASGPQGLAGANASALPTQQGKALEGPFPSLGAACEALVLRGEVKGKTSCEPNVQGFLGSGTPLGYPVFEALYFAPSSSAGTSFYVALRLTSGWYFMKARNSVRSKSDDYELQTISSLSRTNPDGALVALRVRHRHWIATKTPDAYDSADQDQLVVCGLGESLAPTCLEEKLLGPPNTSNVRLDSEGGVHVRTTSGEESFLPIFP
jgi:tetratricopeptide (TPR) repeat protein